MADVPDRMSEDRDPREGGRVPEATACPAPPACPVCGGRLIEVRAKLVCSRCRAICETCCEGGRG